MKALWNDMLSAILLGILLPGAILNTAVTLRGLQVQSENVTGTITVETEANFSGVTVRRMQADGSLVEQDMEEYLEGVVLAEMPTSFEKEALKAQAVAARTYTRKALETGGKHGDGSICTQASCCQAYISPEEYREKGGNEEGLEKVHAAVQETAGECLYYGDELIEATYFSSSGGRTEDAVAVWGTEYPYLRSVESLGEAVSADNTVTFSRDAFAKRLALDEESNMEEWFGETTYTAGGGVAVMEICGKSYTGTELRSLLGLRSTAFIVTVSEDSITITTRGYGHRVGMSQYGADAMAAGGSSYREILAHYYPGTELKKMD